MREFVEFWVHEAPGLPCCLLASDEDIDGDPQAYRCFRPCDPDDPPCAVADALDGLYADPDNRDAWLLYRQIAKRFLSDTHAIPVVLAKVTADLDPETFADRMERLAVIYDVLHPPTDAPKRE